MAKVRENTAITYGDSVRFYLDPHNKTAVPVWQSAKDYNKGWIDVRVGSFTAKARWRDVQGVINDLLKEHYPGNRVTGHSFFPDLSYHSSLNRGTAGKVENYGAGNPYMVQYSRFTPVMKYKLLHPIKTSGPGDFGKVRKFVTEYDWEYIENNWQPEDGGAISFRVTHKTKHPDGHETVQYQSEWLSDPEDALAKFNSRVTGVGGKAYKIPKDLAKVFEKQHKRLGILTDKPPKIKRTTGFTRAQRKSVSGPSGLGGVR